MDDPTHKLKAKFAVSNRYANFGHLLSKMTIKGFRGVETEIGFEYPITAITGTNGSGKSTLAQIAACAYRKISTAAGRRFYVSDFFPVSPVDPTSITDDAEVVYEYLTSKPGDSQKVTVSRASTRWSGYKRQPDRSCQYIGFTLYVPKVEVRDMSIYRSSLITLTSKRTFASAAKYISYILDGAYNDVHFQGIAHAGKEGELGVAERFGAKYSENNMGCGEGRIFYIVDRLETAPLQSLFILEEPETSLHEVAQHRFARYLLSVCERRRHQIILTTHSSALTEALPVEARKFVHRDGGGVRVFDRISGSRVRASLSGGRVGRAILCLEDGFAANMLREILRANDPAALKAVRMVEAGDKKAVLEAKALYEKAGIKAVAVRDADVGADEHNLIFSLPGSLPPEKEVFGCPEVLKEIRDKLGCDFEKIIAQKPDLDHHAYVAEVARNAEEDPAHVQSCVIKWFLAAKGVAWHKAWAQRLLAKI